MVRVVGVSPSNDTDTIGIESLFDLRRNPSARTLRKWAIDYTSS
jgi:hypothetical protein